MASPDLRRYVDLTLADKDPQAIFDAAKADAVAKLPGWVPREGNTEVVVLEELALESGEITFAINRIPGAVVEILLRMFGIDRSPGAPATTVVRFNLSDNAGHVIPAGTVVRLQVGGGLEPLDFATDADLVIAAGAITGATAATATRNIDDANGTAVATPLELVTSIAYVDQALVDAVVAGGAAPELEAAWLDRAIQRLQRLVDTLVLPAHFQTRALEDPAVIRATVLDNWDPTLAAGAGATSAGHVTVAVSGPGGAAVAGATKVALEAAMEASAHAGLDVHVIDHTVTAVDVDVTVVRFAGYADVDVRAAIEASLRSWLNPDTWVGTTVYLNDAIARVDGVAGVDRVTALTLNGAAANLALPGQAKLADFAEPPASVVTVTAP